MPNVQVRDVPEEIHRALVQRAAASGQSLQQFLSAQLAALATTPTMQEIIDQIEARSKGTLSADDVIEALAEDRAGR